MRNNLKLAEQLQNALKREKVFNYENRMENIFHCQVRNTSCTSNLNADLYKDFFFIILFHNTMGFMVENAFLCFVQWPWDDDISYAENIALFNIVHEFIAIT